MIASSNPEQWKALIPDTLVQSFAKNDPPVVFVGSGLGMEAVPSLGTADHLCEMLRKQLRLADHGEGLAELLQYYKNSVAGSKRDVAEWLKGALRFNVAKPGGAHYLLLALPVREVITTNFDLLLNDAAATCRKKIVSADSSNSYRDSLRTLGVNDILLGRLHGSFHSDDKIVATTDDYIESFHEHDWSEIFAEYCRSKRLLFIGYSLRDFNIWTSYITALMRSKHMASAHVMVSPARGSHAVEFWKRYNVNLVQLEAGQFLTGLHSALGGLEKPWLVLRAAAAAHRRMTLNQIDDLIRKVQKEHGFEKRELAALSILMDSA